MPRADVRAWTLQQKLRQFSNNGENKRKPSKSYQLGLSRGTRERALFKLFNTDVSKNSCNYLIKHVKKGK